MTRICLDLFLVAIVLTTMPGRSLRADTIAELSSIRTPSLSSCVRFFPDGSKVAIACDKRIIICEYESGRQVTEISAGKTILKTLWVSDDGERLVTGGSLGSGGLEDRRGEMSL